MITKTKCDGCSKRKPSDDVEGGICSACFEKMDEGIWYWSGFAHDLEKAIENGEGQ